VRWTEAQKSPGSNHLQADCQEPGSAPEPYARQPSTGYTFTFFYLSITTESSWSCIDDVESALKALTEVPLHSAHNGRVIGVTNEYSFHFGV